VVTEDASGTQALEVCERRWNSRTDWSRRS
jgi:hypothetical protein